MYNRSKGESEGSEEENTCQNDLFISHKLVILGDVAVGKSSIAQR
jgi:GTPase SAR1 family protein